MGSKYGHLSHNWHEDLVNRLGGEEMAEAFKRGTHPLQLAAVPELHFRLRMESTSFNELRVALKRPSHVDEKIAQSLRQSEVGEVELVFVRCLVKDGLDISDAPSWMRGRGLTFVDPFVLMAWNATHPEFSNNCRNLTQWPGPHRFPVAAKFGYGFSSRETDFELREQHNRSWGSSWWFAGTPIL